MGPLERPHGGSIPAFAGEPPPEEQDRYSVGVYPRVCGGTGCPSRLIRPCPGLSPRLRGNLKWSVTGPARDGSIPAFAGEPAQGGAGGENRPVYPRVCGEPTDTGPRVGQVRSIPAFAGEPIRPLRTFAGYGSIPAFAGEPPAAPERQLPCRVYPRVCGGTHYCRLAELPRCGLSPRCGGTHRRHCAI